MSQLTPHNLTSENMRAALASELAVGITPIPDILKRFGLDSAGLKLLLKEPIFRNMVTQYKREWNEASNAKERIKIKAAVAVEEGLLELYRIYNDIELNPSARLDAFKQLVNLADVAPKNSPHEGGPKFNLTLNLGDKAPITIDAEAVTDE